MITGSMVALVTPMLHSGEVDWAALASLIDWHVASGTSAIVAVGTSGESATLNPQEHCQVIEYCVQHAAGRIPIIAGTGANSTTEAIDLTAAAHAAGAAACLLVTPYYNKPTQEGLYRHHKAVAEAVPIDQILYNVPGRTACDMLPATVLRLAELGNIIGIKEATGDMQRARELIERCPPGFAIYSGDDATALELILLGGHGDISVTANVAPAQMAAMCKAALAGDKQTASELNRPLELLHQRLFVEANPIPVKWALYAMGRIGDGIRLPLTELAAEFQPVVREALHQAGIQTQD